jgi:transcriptional regulator with XRE-family HTH domain
MSRSSDPSVLRSFGERVRALRRARGLTQAQLAEAAELQTPAISRIESGQLGVSTSSAVRLARALGVSVAELFGAASPQPPAPDTSRLDPEERLLVERWRALPERERRTLRVLLSWAEVQADVPGARSRAAAVADIYDPAPHVLPRARPRPPADPTDD